MITPVAFSEMNTCHAPQDGKFCSGANVGIKHPSDKFVAEVRSWGYPNPIGFPETIIDNRGAIHVTVYPMSTTEAMLNSLRSFEQQKGFGTALMKRVVDAADKHGVTLKLDVHPLGQPKGRITKRKLTEFYKRFGFQTTRGHMVRRPQR